MATMTDYVQLRLAILDYLNFVIMIHHSNSNIIYTNICTDSELEEALTTTFLVIYDVISYSFWRV